MLLHCACTYSIYSVYIPFYLLDLLKQTLDTLWIQMYKTSTPIYHRISSNKYIIRAQNINTLLLFFWYGPRSDQHRRHHHGVINHKSRFWQLQSIEFSMERAYDDDDDTLGKRTTVLWFCNLYNIINVLQIIDRTMTRWGLCLCVHIII